MNNQDTRFANQYAIQWFPGHMAKTLRMMEQEIQHVDASLVLLDARIPLSSLNPEIERITADVYKRQLLGGVDRRSGGIQRVFGAGLYLAEHQCSVRFSQDEVYLPHPGVIVVGDEGRALFLVETRGGCFSPTIITPGWGR